MCEQQYQCSEAGSRTYGRNRDRSGSTYGSSGVGALGFGPLLAALIGHPRFSGNLLHQKGLWLITPTSGEWSDIRINALAAASRKFVKIGLYGHGSEE